MRSQLVFLDPYVFSLGLYNSIDLYYIMVHEVLGFVPSMVVYRK